MKFKLNNELNSINCKAIMDRLCADRIHFIVERDIDCIRITPDINRLSEFTTHPFYFIRSSSITFKEKSIIYKYSLIIPFLVSLIPAIIFFIATKLFFFSFIIFTFLMLIFFVPAFISQYFFLKRLIDRIKVDMETAK